MAIETNRDKQVQLPPDAINRIAEALAALPDLPGAASARVVAEGEDAQMRQALTPHKVYRASAADVRPGPLLEKAQCVGWRYILLDGEKILGAANFSGARVEEVSSFQSLIVGSLVDATVKLLQSERFASWVSDGQYELRLLLVDELGFAGLWLHRYDDKSKDFVVPLEVSRLGLTPGERYGPEQIQAQLSEWVTAMERAFLKRP